MKNCCVIVCVLVFLGGCGATPVPTPVDKPIDSANESIVAVPRPQPGPRIAESNCRYPLGDLCEVCNTYTVRMAELARSKVRHLRFGECGAFRFIHWSDGFQGTKEYFDTDGRLVGARVAVDYARSCLTGAKPDADAEYGDVPVECNK